MLPRLSVFVILALAAVEGIAWWWMHPVPAGKGEPILVYQPKGRVGPHRDGNAGNNSLQSSIPDPHSSSYTPLPEIVSRALPSLHCSSGTAARIDRENGVTIHLAFFEWDQSGTTNVLEAFRHLPDECMGSIGMKLIEKPSPRVFRIGGEAITFDHTVFRDPRGSIIHAFKGTWVSGASTLLGDGIRGGAEQWRQLRWRAALTRFRPSSARVAQGAVRGARNADGAWAAFQDEMLRDLTFEK